MLNGETPLEVRQGCEAARMTLARLLEAEGLEAGSSGRRWLLRDLGASGRSQVWLEGRPAIVRRLG